jgi:hypothetical protein
MSTSGAGRGGRRSGAGRKARDITFGLVLLEALRQILRDEARGRAEAEIRWVLWRADLNVRKTPKKTRQEPPASELRTLRRGKQEYRVPQGSVWAAVLMYAHGQPELGEFRAAGWVCVIQRRYLERLRSLLRSGALEQAVVTATGRMTRPALTVPLTPAQRKASLRTIERAIGDALEFERNLMGDLNAPPQEI